MTTHAPTPDRAAIADGVESAFTRWLCCGDHDGNLPINDIREGVESAFREWLAANTPALIAAIAERSSMAGATDGAAQ